MTGLGDRHHPDLLIEIIGLRSSMGQTIYEAPKEPEQSPQQLVVEAHRLLINIAAKDGSNFDRLEKLEEKAQERLFRRLDRLSGGVAPKPR